MKGSVVGFSLAAVSAVLFPPSSLVIGSALAAGAGAGALAWYVTAADLVSQSCLTRSQCGKRGCEQA